MFIMATGDIDTTAILLVCSNNGVYNMHCID